MPAVKNRSNMEEGESIYNNYTMNLPGQEEYTDFRNIQQVVIPGSVIEY